MTDLDLRLVRYFTAVAEHRHFGRAAEALHITQPSLSRQIRRLEQQLGARLLERTPQGSRLTEAGEVFLPRGKALLRSAGQAAALTRAAAEPSRITVGYTLGIIVTPAVRALRERFPDADVRTAYVDWSERTSALSELKADVLVTRLPFPTEGTRVTVLYSEPRVVVLPVGHRLAGRESVTLDDIAEEPMVRVADPEWNAYWRIDPRPDGRPAPGGPLLEGGLEDKFELVASGQALAITALPHAGALRPDVVAVPLDGVDPAHVVLASRAEDRGRLVTGFRRVAREHLTGPAR
ncbi:LysR family transcriptional regulator [Streptomyces sp. 351MFTsu5.1]|uniref:LysR family transcriptional regulator n=1 Tax=Streptomyces sp. 351MFTsu5.1 TaxID=1172180 RepID=UPI0003659C58|nr:LysR family transcriptional regulator [Streptomyces sp. 351MFTsu5.1]